MWVYFWPMYSVSLICVSVLMPCCFDYYSVVQLEIWECDTSNSIVYSLDCFGYLGSFVVTFREGNGNPLQYYCLENPWMEEPGRLQSMGSLRVRHGWVTSLSLFTFMHWIREWQPTPVFLPGESQGWGSLVGCRLWGCTESDTIEVT